MKVLQQQSFATRWASLMAIAERNLGLFTSADAASCGISRQTLHDLVQAGRISRLFPGVFAVVGVADSWTRAAKATLLAGGPAAALHGEAAGYAHGLLDVGQAPIRLVFPHGRRRAVPGVRTSESRRLTADDVTTSGHLRLTVVEWTLDELVARRGERWGERAFYDAWRRRLTDDQRLAAFVAGSRRLRSRPALTRIVDRATPALARAASPAETDGLLEIRDAGLPPPEVNYKVRLAGRTRYVDLAWPLVKFAGEVDGWWWHSIAPDVAADRARQDELEEAGWSVSRIPAAWLRREPGRAAALIRRRLQELGHPAVR